MRILISEKRTSDYQFLFYYFLIFGYIFNFIWYILYQVVAFLSIQLLKNLIFHSFSIMKTLSFFGYHSNHIKLSKITQIHSNIISLCIFPFFSIKNNFDLPIDPPLHLIMSKFALFSNVSFKSHVLPWKPIAMNKFV